MSENAHKVSPARPWEDSRPDEDAGGSKPLSRDEARALLARQPSLPPMLIVWAQAAVGVAGALVAYGVTLRVAAGWSALAGGLIAALPSALMLYGLKKSALRQVAAGFVVWELVKIAASVALFALAAVSVPRLEWLPMLLTFIVALKAYWLAALRGAARGGTKNRRSIEA
jgi:ATP synthase protein I